MSSAVNNPSVSRLSASAQAESAPSAAASAQTPAGLPQDAVDFPQDGAEFPQNAAGFPPDGVVLYAKQSGITSFTSLWAIKRALDTSKIGHTGTLDNFADGLLVVLSNRMTKFVSHITAFDKTYEAIIKFGEETDTLDIDGNVVATAPLPSERAFADSARAFTGALEQIPPRYSAIQVNGRRASDLARAGRRVELAPRPVFVYENAVLEFAGGYAHIRVRCSKGTYIRALARDMAERCGTKAHLVALRRCAVGPFRLEDAAGFEKLPDFCIANLPRLTERKSSPAEIEEPDGAEIRRAVLPFTPELARACGFKVLLLKPEFYAKFLGGRPVRANAFYGNLESAINAGKSEGADGTDASGNGASSLNGNGASVSGKNVGDTLYIASAGNGANASVKNANDNGKSAAPLTEASAEDELVVFAERNAEGRELALPRLCGMVNRKGSRVQYVFVIQDDLPQARPVNRQKPKPKTRAAANSAQSRGDAACAARNAVECADTAANRERTAACGTVAGSADGVASAACAASADFADDTASAARVAAVCEVSANYADDTAPARATAACGASADSADDTAPAERRSATCRASTECTDASVNERIIICGASANSADNTAPARPAAAYGASAERAAASEDEKPALEKL